MNDERGFTIIEVMVAAMILVVGLLGTLSLMDGANQATTATKAREGGVNLQREVIELARSVPYQELLPGSIVPEIRDRGLDDSSISGGWRVQRRGVTYTISVGVCSVDDPTDMQGVRIAGRFCSTGSGQTSAAQCAAILAPGATGTNPDCGTDPSGDGEVDGLVSTAQSCPGGCTNPLRDLSPDDYKRIITLVRWDRGQGSRWSVQTSTIPNPGHSAAPRVLTLTPENAVYSSSGATQAFAVTTSRPPQKTQLFVDGAEVAQTCGGQPLVSVQWTCSWNFGAVNTPQMKPDGTYVVTAKAIDEYNAAGASRSTTFRLNRRLPPPAQGVVAGENALHGVVEVAWQSNVDGDVERYEARRLIGQNNEQLACSTTSRTDCYYAATLNQNTTYRLYSIDTDNAGNERAPGAPSWAVAAAVNPPPEPVSGLVATTSNGNTILTWNAPNQSGNRPDVDFYRIYRRSPVGTPQAVPNIAWRYDATGSGTELTFVDTKTDGQQWDYWVTAAGLELAESTPVRVRR